MPIWSALVQYAPNIYMFIHPPKRTGSQGYWTGLILGDKEELVQTNNYNGNDPLKMLAVFSLLNPKIIGTPVNCA